MAELFQEQRVRALRQHPPSMSSTRPMRTWNSHDRVQQRRLAEQFSRDLVNEMKPHARRTSHGLVFIGLGESEVHLGTQISTVEAVRGQ